MNIKQLENAFNSVGINYVLKQTQESNKTQITIYSTDIGQLVKLIELGREAAHQQS
jgi:hypothetical protein